MIKINIGCGWRNFGKEWIHIDGGDYEHLDYKDITNLEFADNSVDLIYASHVIEYFDQEQIKEIFKEWRRVLKKQGVLRIAVPNFQTMAQLYCDKKISLKQIIGPLYGKMKMGENLIYHKTVYDFDTLKILLMECGFNNISLYDWRKTEHCTFDDHSQAYIPHMDKDNGMLISLNVESFK